MHRKEFIQNVLLGTVPLISHSLNSFVLNNSEDYIMTVNGPVPAHKLGFTLSHEHVLVDFIGAAAITPQRYNATDAYTKSLPFLQAVAQKGCKTVVECTPDYLGRNPALLKQLSDASGLHIITNTGYYGASKEKFLPAHAYTETADQLAERWINEWKFGIGTTSIKPGFIKTGVDTDPLSEMQRKLIHAAALTHVATGLTIGVHTGNAAAALEELEILKSEGVSAEAWIWIHAQNENNLAIHKQIAKSGGWVSFDGLNNENAAAYITLLQEMKAGNLLHKILISQDAGWYNVGEPGGGNYRSHETVFTHLLPLLRKKGFTRKDIDQVFIKNPANAFTIKIRKS